MAKPKDTPVVAETYFWLDAPTEMFKIYVESVMRPAFSGSLGVSKNPEDDNGMPVEFQNYIAQIFENELDYPVNEWRFWVGVTQPGAMAQHAKGFAKGFPHSHGWNALTAVHYVQVPESGGDLLIVDEDHNELERFVPRVGLTAVVDGWSLHGVTAVGGNIPRYTLIATGFDKGERNFRRGRR